VATTKLQYDRERIEFGDGIKTLRKSKGLTGHQLAKEAGISQSKLSKIETGALVPSTDDLQKILPNLGASQSTIKRLIELARALRTEFVSWRFEHRQGLAAKQIDVGEMEKQAKCIRVFQNAIIPGLLNIPAYARCVLDFANVSGQSDVDRAVAARIGRQQILYEPERQFEFLITEGAALSRFCDPQIVIQQLDRLSFLFGLPNIKIGFLPNRVVLPQIPVNSFAIFDSNYRVVETLTGEVATVDQEDIAIYLQTFESLASAAIFGAHADPILDEWKKLLASWSASSSGVRINEASALIRA